MTNVISECDSEADIYGYLISKMANQQRFVVRLIMSRHIHRPDKLYQFATDLKSDKQQIHIGCKAREAKLDVTYAAVTLKLPSKAWRLERQ